MEKGKDRRKVSWGIAPLGEFVKVDLVKCITNLKNRRISPHVVPPLRTDQGGMNRPDGSPKVNITEAPRAKSIAH